MKYENTLEAIFLKRVNRFVAMVLLRGKEVEVHVKNTGRCIELLLQNVKVILYDSMNPQRKTRYDLIAVWKENIGWVNIDSQVPNIVVKEWLFEKNGLFPGITKIKPECKYNDSRFDFYIEQEEIKTFIEVKGCTLERNMEGFFPDAPTKRGIKHLRELMQAKEEGYQAYLVFVIAIPGVKIVHPNIEIQEEFGTVLEQAMDVGIKVIFLSCETESDAIMSLSYEVVEEYTKIR